MAKKVVGCRLIPALVGPKLLLLGLMSDSIYLDGV